MDALVVNFLNGLSYGMILFIIASGFSLIFGTMGVLNAAHGSLYVVGGLFGVTVATRFGGNFFLAALIGGIGVGLIGLLLERLFLSRLHKQVNEQVLLTLGLVYILKNLVDSVWDPGISRMGVPPDVFAGVLTIGAYNFPRYRFVIMVVGMAIAVGLWVFQEKTRAGAIIRAGMDDKPMTQALGVNYAAVATMTFSLAAFLVGFAGFAASPVIGIYSGMAQDILVLALVVVVIGGVGYVQGALLGAVLIGLIDAFGKVFFPDFAAFTVYALMIVMLLVRPSGLVGKESQG